MCWQSRLLVLRSADRPGQVSVIGARRPGNAAPPVDLATGTFGKTEDSASAIRHFDRLASGQDEQRIRRQPDQLVDQGVVRHVQVHRYGGRHPRTGWSDPRCLARVYVDNVFAGSLNALP